MFERRILTDADPARRFEGWMSASFWTFVHHETVPDEQRLAAARSLRGAGHDALVEWLLAP